MHTIEIPDTNQRYYIPEDLSECDKTQYLDISELIFQYQNQIINYDEFRTHAIYRLLNMKPAKVSQDLTELELEDQQIKFANIYQLSELIDSFFYVENDVKIIKQEYIHNPVPRFKPTLKTYYGPSDSFMNMTFGEYLDGMRLFHDFHATGDMTYLKLLAAVFYRPKKSFHCLKKHLANYDGDIREVYNHHTIEARAKEMQLAPIGFIYGFYLLFASFQKHLIEAVITWGGQELDLSILFETSKEDSGSSDKVPGIGMDSIAFSLAASGEFGTLEKVRKIEFWIIIVRMYELRRTDLERQKNEKNASNKST